MRNSVRWRAASNCSRRRWAGKREQSRGRCAMTILVAILGLIALIVIHELGHMLVAKALGVNVPEFGIGFGPALFKTKIGKTVYSLRIILFGGFAKMEGMEGVASVEETTGERGPRSYLSKPPWRRALIIFAGPFANLVAAVVILAGVYIAGVPTDATTEVEEVVPGSMASEVGMQEGPDNGRNGEGIESWAQSRRSGGTATGHELEVAVYVAGSRGSSRGARWGSRGPGQGHSWSPPGHRIHELRASRGSLARGSEYGRDNRALRLVLGAAGDRRHRLLRLRIQSYRGRFGEQRRCLARRAELRAASRPDQHKPGGL